MKPPTVPSPGDPAGRAGPRRSLRPAAPWLGRPRPPPWPWGTSTGAPGRAPPSRPATSSCSRSVRVSRDGFDGLELVLRPLRGVHQPEAGASRRGLVRGPVHCRQALVGVVHSHSDGSDTSSASGSCGGRHEGRHGHPRKRAPDQEITHTPEMLRFRASQTVNRALRGLQAPVVRARTTGPVPYGRGGLFTTGGTSTPPALWLRFDLESRGVPGQPVLRLGQDPGLRLQHPYSAPGRAARSRPGQRALGRSCRRTLDRSIERSTPMPPTERRSPKRVLGDRHADAVVRPGLGEPLLTESPPAHRAPMPPNGPRSGPLAGQRPNYRRSSHHCGWSTAVWHVYHQ